MARRPAPVQSFNVSGTGVADQSIKDKPGILYAFNITWSGANVDDLIHIEDALEAAAANVKRFTFRFPTTAGSYSAVLPDVGYGFVTGIWANLQLAGAKISLNVGFD